MDDIFLSKSDSTTSDNRRRNNVQIVATLRSETDGLQNNKTNSDVSKHNHVQSSSDHDFSRATTSSASDKKKEENKQETKKEYIFVPQPNNDLGNLQEDIVNIAESLHNLVRMVNGQTDKINFIEKEMSKINDDVKSISDQSVTIIPDTKKIQVHHNLNDQNKKEINTQLPIKQQPNQFKNISMTRHQKQSRYDCDSSSAKEEVSCLSETTATHCNNNEVEEKLNNITKEFNNELLNMKRKQALIAVSYLKRYHHHSK